MTNILKGMFELWDMTTEVKTSQPVHDYFRAACLAYFISRSTRFTFLFYILTIFNQLLYLQPPCTFLLLYIRYYSVFE